MATGNHSTKPVFFFFHFFPKPYAEGKLTECQLTALRTENKAENNTETELQKQKVVCVSPFQGPLILDSSSSLSVNEGSTMAIFEFHRPEYSEDKIDVGFYL